MKHPSVSLSRRSFLSRSAALGVFSIVPRHVLGGAGHTPPSETVNIASVGAGRRARAVIQSCRNAGGVNYVAFCDVDEQAAATTYGEYPNVPKYRDFRRMLEKEDRRIDAVIVGTPDHVHAVATLAAMQRGKHVFCEKPLARTLYEARTVTEAARRYGVVTQLGNQGHSYEHIRRFCEWIWDGAIGHVREIHAFADSSYGHAHDYPRLRERPPVPATLDWDLWLGPVPARPYHPMFVPGSWRGWRPFGTGVLGDWTCHIIDPVFWALKLGAPTGVVAEVGDYDPQKFGLTFPKELHLTYQFPARGELPPVTLHWYTQREPPRPADLEPGRKLPRKGAYVVGDKGTILYGSHGAGDCLIIPQSKMKAYQRPPQTLKRSPGHYREWIDACKTGQPSPAGFDYGGPLTEIALIGNIASLLPGETLHWNSTTLKFENSEQANGCIRPVYRDGWSLGEKA
jgi:predicted dehydrogenase